MVTLVTNDLHMLVRIVRLNIDMNCLKSQYVLCVSDRNIGYCGNWNCFIKRHLWQMKCYNKRLHVLYGNILCYRNIYVISFNCIPVPHFMFVKKNYFIIILKNRNRIQYLSIFLLVYNTIYIYIILYNSTYNIPHLEYNLLKLSKIYIYIII